MEQWVELLHLKVTNMSQGSVPVAQLMIHRIRHVSLSLSHDLVICDLGAREREKESLN